MARYPDNASPYYVESSRGCHVVCHTWFGVLEQFDCLGAAEGFIADREDEDEREDEAQAEAGFEHDPGIDLSIAEAA